MSEKDEALEHLSAIKSVLVDKDSFFPYNYNALVVWGVIGMVLTLFMAPMLENSLMVGMIFIIIMMAIGFVVEGFLTKKVNANYDIDDCTHRQKFIMQMFLAETIFGVLMTAIFAKHGLMALIFPLWVMLMGMGDHSLGFVLNLKIFKTTSVLKMVSASLLVAGSLFIEDLQSHDTVFFYISQGVTFVLLGILPIMIGRKLREEV